MFSYLQIYDPRERTIVGLADAGLRLLRAASRIVPGRRATVPPRRILLLRLERIGDLLMSAPAIQAVRSYAPQAEIDLVVGSWNAPLARLIPGIDRVEPLDAPWLARGAAGSSPRALLARAWRWRARRYDLAINFEGDIRSHALMALSGAPVRAGFDMAGGGPLLTIPVDHRPTEHTTANAWRIVQAAFGLPPGAAGAAATADANAQPSRGTSTSRQTNASERSADAKRSGAGTDEEAASAFPDFRLALPDDVRAQAADMLRGRGLIIGLHASGGRAIKQWPARRFGEVAARLLADHGDATLLLTGAPGDRPMVDDVLAVLRETLGAAAVDARVLDLTGEVELPLLAALLQRCVVFITGDTGPMHLAAAVGTPIAAVFGPSMPVRYAPISTEHRIVRIDLPCAPCNQIRLPPARCQGHTPDCLEGVTVDMVHRAAADLLARRGADERGMPAVSTPVPAPVSAQGRPVAP